jgi:hypothetical protein
MNLRAMNMLYESIVKRGSLMVVPSGLADSLNVPSLLGMMGGAGLLPGHGRAEAALMSGSESGGPAKGAGAEGSAEPRKEP